ncbi:MAG TPA: HEAT repeat domain-containing protein [Chloroflexi bacterium]|nr:HEAT repeat domain-containing protein [Chloroflexota bacterium]
MVNHKVLEAAAEWRHSQHRQAQRTYTKHGDRVPQLIRQLAGPTQEIHDRAFDLLRQMGALVIEELLAALADPALDPIAADEVISLLGVTGEEAAKKPVWQFLQANLDDPERASTAALSLAGLGDERALPYLREGLDDDDEDRVSNSVAGLIMVGELEDVEHLRKVHRRHLTNSEIRSGVASAILTILESSDERTFSRIMDHIRTSFADRYLWADIWDIMEREFGSGQQPIH